MEQMHLSPLLLPHTQMISGRCAEWDHEDSKTDSDDADSSLSIEK